MSVMTPRHYTTEELLRDGGSICIWAIRPDDTLRLLALFERLSSRSVYFRFFQTKQRLTDEELGAFTALDCVQAGVRGIVVMSSGFAEASATGREAERRLHTLVRASGMRLVGPNCMGLLNTDPQVALNATFTTPSLPPAGNIGMVSQSGALGLAMLDYVQTLHVGVSTFVSVGNRADVSSNDLLAYWADDPRTDVIVLYLESFGNPRRFARIAPEVAQRKPIIAVKSGRSAAGSRAAASHSAALATSDIAVEALFAQAGVIRANTLQELFDVAVLLSTQPLPPGPRVGVVTNAGGPGLGLEPRGGVHVPGLTW